MDETSKGGMGIASLVIVVVLLFMKFALIGDVEDNRIEIGFNPNDLIVIEKREGYERCDLTKYPQKCDSLMTLWNTFRHKDTDVMERMFSFSFTHRDKYKNLLNHAFYSEEDVLFGLPLSDQNEILKLRAIVSSMYTKEELESSDHSELISDIFIIVHESDRNFSDLKAVFSSEL